MKKKSSINLCDYRGTYDSLETMLKKYNLYCEYLDLLCVPCEADEVWLGSEFCENLFLCYSTEHYQEKINFFKTQGLNVLIAIPELHEINFGNIMCIIEQMGNVDGFVVNDIGTALKVHSKFPNKKLILGRSFDKSVREIRLEPSKICKKYEQETDNIFGGISDSTHLSFFKSIGAMGITTDSVPFLKTNFSNIEYPIYFQYPRIVLSQAAICEFSQVDGNNPLMGCKFGCFNYAKNYNLSNLSVIKMGKIIFYKEKRAIDQCVSGDVRLVYTL